MGHALIGMNISGLLPQAKPEKSAEFGSVNRFGGNPEGENDMAAAGEPFDKRKGVI